MKKLIGILIDAMMSISILSVASAADIGTISAVGVGNFKIEQGKRYSTDENGNISISSDDNYNILYKNDTLFLKDANIKDSVYVFGGMTVNLKGDNKIKSSVGIQVFESEDTNNSLTIDGNGKIEIISLNEGLNNSCGDIIIKDAEIRIEHTQSCAIWAGENDLTIEGNAKIYLTGCHSGSMDAKKITIEGKSYIKAEDTIDASEKIIMADEAEVIVSTSGRSAINGGNGIEIQDKAKVEATGDVALNSYYGNILIGKEAQAEITGLNNANAAMSVGTNYPNSNCSIYIYGTLCINGSANFGISISGIGNIEIDGGNVEINDTPFGIATGFYANAGGNMTLENNAQLKIKGSAMGTYPQIGTSKLTVDNSKIDVEASSWGIYWPGEIELKDSTVVCNTNGRAIGNSSGITYNYKEGYAFLAGDAENSAEKIYGEDEQKAHLIDKYIKIEHAEAYTVTIEDSYSDNSGEGSYSAGDRVTIDAGNRDGYEFEKWTSDANIVFEDEFSLKTAFIMPDENVTIYAEWEKDKTSSGGRSSYQLEEKERDTDNKDNEDEGLKIEDESLFDDVSIDDPYYDSIKEAYEKGYMDGIGDRLFAPNGYLTRAMASQIIWNIAGHPEPDDVAPFLDVTSDTWYSKAVAWCYEQGVIVGYDEFSFGPEDYVTEEQFDIMLDRFNGVKPADYFGVSVYATRKWVAWKITEK